LEKRDDRGVKKDEMFWVGVGGSVDMGELGNSALRR
jgi:hypothetical protein